MTYIDKLQTWVEKEKQNGLLNIKFSPSLNNDSDINLEIVAKSALDLLTLSSGENITNKEL